MNPDKEAWYGQVNGNDTLFKSKEDGLAVSAKNFTDIHQRFHIWFLWGFITFLAVIVFSIIQIVLSLLEIFDSAVLIAYGILGCLTGCTTLAWWIVGIVWRFNDVGIYSCGDIIPKETTESVWHETIRAEGSLYQV